MTLIAAAQSCAHPADLPRNLDDHLRLMRIAQARGVRLLVFPELSLTGYEPTAAAALAQPADTPLLQPLRQLAEQARILYIASALIGENGYPADSALLAGYAREHGMGVLLANHGGPTGGWKAAGRSAFWNERGALVRETTGTGETLLLLERTEIDA